MTITALCLSGGGAKGDFEVGVICYLNDHGVVPRIVCSTSVGSVSALKVAEGPTGIPALEAAWLGLLGNGNMYAREGWTTDPDFESTILGATARLLTDPPTSDSVNDIVSLTTMANVISASYPVTGEFDLNAVPTVIRIAGFLPVAGQILGLILGAVGDELLKLLQVAQTQTSLFNLNPLRDLVSSQINHAAIDSWAAKGNMLRMATVGLASGRLRFVREDGTLTERDGTTPAIDTSTGRQISTSLITGMQASASIPVVFEAVPIGDDLYVDGGIRAVLPTEVAAQLGATTIYGVQASVKELARQPALQRGKLLDIALRSLMDISIDEIAYSDSNRFGSWGPNVTATFIQPRIDIHDPFTIYPAFIRNRMAYGYMSASDAISASPPSPAAGKAADEISIIRTAIARLEAYVEGRPIPPTMVRLGRPSPPVRGNIISDIKTLKQRLRAQVNSRIAAGGAMPPLDTSWTDHREWWQNWEKHPLHQEGAPPNSHICALSCTGNRLDAFLVSQPGTILQASWRPHTKEGWQGWYQVGIGLSGPGAIMAAASRHDGSIDLITTGTDGRIYAAQWDQAFANATGWQGWSDILPVTTGHTVIGAGIAIVSRRPEFLDAFILNPDGTVWTAALDPADPTWRGWWQIGALKGVPGGQITAVSRSLDNLDIFLTNSLGIVNWSHWDPNSGGWTAFMPPIPASTRPGAPVAAVSRSNGLIDIFFTGPTGIIFTAGFNPATGWGGWWQIPGILAPAGAPIGVVSAKPDNLDVFVVDTSGHIQTAHWDPSVGKWSQWTNILGGTVAAGTPITAVSRAPGFIDIFYIGNDGMAVTAGFSPDGGWAGYWRLAVSIPDNPLDPTLVTGTTG